MRTDALKCPGSQNYPPKLHFYPNFFISSSHIRVNSSRISNGLCWHAAARVSQPKSETKFIKYCYETITNGLKKYCDEPFKDKPSHLLYGATNGPRGRMLRVFLPIIDVLKVLPLVLFYIQFGNRFWPFNCTNNMVFQLDTIIRLITEH